MELEKQQRKLVDSTYPELFLSFVISVQARGNLIALREPVRSDEHSVTCEPGTCSLASSAHTSTRAWLLEEGPACRKARKENGYPKLHTANCYPLRKCSSVRATKADVKCNRSSAMHYVLGGKSASIHVFFFVAYHLNMLVNAR